MRNVALIALLAFSLATGRFAKYFRDTNSAAANKRGVSAFAKKDFAGAEKSFRKADEIAPTGVSAFDAGTAAAAANHHEQALRDLSRASADPSLKADAIFNRGNDHLASKAYDGAIRDFVDVLKMRPADRDAKRNLEIALRKKSEQEKQQQQGGGQKQQQQQQQSRGQQQPQPQSGGKQNSTGSPDVDALLRSVQQQEREELSRMRQNKGEPRKIGW